MATANVPLEELARLPDFYHPVASPTDTAIAYYYDGTGRNELYVDHLDGAPPTRVSDGDVPRSARWWIRWRGDGETILFHRDDDGDEQNDIWEIDLDGNARPVVETSGQTIIYETTPDGNDLLYGANHEGQMNLYRYDRAADRSVKLTDYEQPVWGARISPDASTIAYTTNESSDLANRDVYVADFADGGAARRLDIGEEGAETEVRDWHPTDDLLLIADNTTDTPRPGVVDLATDEVTWYGEPAYVESPMAFDATGAGFVGWRIDEAAYKPIHFDLDGSVEVIDLDTGVAMFPNGGWQTAFLANGKLLISNTTTTARKQLYAYDFTTATADTIREPEYGSIDPDRFVPGEYATYESFDGREIGGILYDAGVRPSPVIVAVHGGPHGQSVRRFDQYAQFFVDRGYSVFQPNYRGSTGRGRTFKHLIHHDWGGGEADDIAEAGRWLAGKDWVDEDRLIVYGGSYGGYSTFWQLVSYPGLWATGIAWVGITDLLHLYETSMPHFKSVLEQQLGDPEENADLYRERSPITHVENIEDPLLIVHGVNDPRCPIDQARRFRDALVERRGWVEGEDFVYHELAEEGHGTTDLDQKVRAFRIVENYLDDWA